MRFFYPTKGWTPTLFSEQTPSSARAVELYCLCQVLATRSYVSCAASNKRPKVGMLTMCINWKNPYVAVDNLYFVILVYEGVEEYSCKYFAVRKEKLKLSKNQQGPLVRIMCRHATCHIRSRMRTLTPYNCRLNASVRSVAMMK